MHNATRVAANSASHSSMSLTRWMSAASALLRRVIGAPDYDGYCRHVAAAHPGREPLPEREFLEERLKARYSTPGNRCC